MAEQKPVVIFENLMKAYKYDYENASNPLVKTQAKQKANKLREMASLFGIDQKELDLFGPDIKLKDTPGGQSIDYGALAQTGKLWSGMTGADPQSIAKRGIGQAIVTGLPRFGRTAGATPRENAGYSQYLQESPLRVPAGFTPGSMEQKAPMQAPAGYTPGPMTQEATLRGVTGGPTQGMQKPESFATGGVTNLKVGKPIIVGEKGPETLTPVKAGFNAVGQPVETAVIQPLPNVKGTNQLPYMKTMEYIPERDGLPIKKTLPYTPVPGGPTITPLTYTGSGSNALDGGGAGAGTYEPPKDVVVDAAGDEEPVSGTVGANNATMKAYVEAGDFNGWITSQQWCPSIVDPTTGKKTPDYAKFDAGMWATWSNQMTLFGSAAALVDTANGAYTKIEEQPGWKEYLSYMDIDLQARLDNAKSAYDNTAAHLQNAQASIGAREKVALAGIQNVLNISMWKSRQSLAATGMVFSGLLAWGYQQGMFQAQQDSAEVIIASSEAFNNIAIDLATLGADYELEKKNSKNAQIAEIALERYKWLYGENEEYLAAKKALDGAMSALGIAEQTAPGVIAGTNQGAAATAKKEQQDLVTSMLEKDILVTFDKNGSPIFQRLMSLDKLADLKIEGYDFSEYGDYVGYTPTLKDQVAWLQNGIMVDPETGRPYQVLSPQEVLDYQIQGYSVDERGGILAYAPTDEQIATWLENGIQYHTDPKTGQSWFTHGLTPSEAANYEVGMKPSGGGTEKPASDPFGTGYKQTDFDNDLKLLDKAVNPTMQSYLVLKIQAGTGAGINTNKGFSNWLMGTGSGELIGVDGKPIMERNSAGEEVPMMAPASLGFFALTEPEQDKLIPYLPPELGLIATVAGDLKRSIEAGVPLNEGLIQSALAKIVALDADGKPIQMEGGGEAGGKGTRYVSAIEALTPVAQERIRGFLAAMFASPPEAPISAATVKKAFVTNIFPAMNRFYANWPFQLGTGKPPTP
jgi:hypothetical protein